LLDTTRTCARRTPRHSETVQLLLSLLRERRTVVEWPARQRRLYRDDPSRWIPACAGMPAIGRKRSGCS
ncbi:MAG TPA: hypothetical protein P5569_14490, partial [Candidatus Latescibacteria bacterium]|nr:hypothetical protein [Candidatus Latescibacterota bacterium]